MQITISALWSISLLWGFLCLFSPAQAQLFQEVSQAAGLNHIQMAGSLMGGGIAILDYDQDGWEDVYLTGGQLRDQFYRNNGDGSFTEIGLEAGFAITEILLTLGAIALDYDNDGWPDLLVMTGENSPCLLFHNQGDGTFAEVGASAGLIHRAFSLSATAADFNRDGWLDIYVANYVDEASALIENEEVVGFDHLCYVDYLYINQGNGTFVEMAATLGMDEAGCGLAATFTDYDQDGDQDVLVANDFGEWILPNVLWQNEAPVLGVSDQSQASGLNAALYGMGLATGDYDLDGDWDYYVTNLGRNVLHRNQGNATFVDVSTAAGVENTYSNGLLTTGWGTAFMDVNHDTYPDLFVANGQIPAADFIATAPEDPNKLYLNQGNGTFVDVSEAAGVDSPWKGRGMAYTDYDRDRDLDVLVACVSATPNSGEHSLLYQNQYEGPHHWLQIKLVGTVSNRDALGSRVQVEAGGLLLLRELSSGGSHASSHSPILHVGLGAATLADQITVYWPNGGVQTLTNVAANQRITIIEEMPQMRVLGQGVLIANGDEAASPEDLTDFGQLLLNQEALIRTFEIRNAGNVPLLLTGQPQVELSGDFSALFEVLSAPQTELAPGESTFFQVRFQPLTEGFHGALVRIASNDFYNAAYVFALRAIVSQQTSARLNVRGNGLSIASGDETPSEADFTNFGNLVLGQETEIRRTFWIENLGNAPLQLTGNPMIALLNNTGGAFQLVQLPPAMIPPGGQASFQVRFQSSSPGLQSAQVRILSNDPLQNPYTFLVQAWAQALPRMQVRGEPGEVILSSSSLPTVAQGTLFPTVMQGQLPSVQVFRIENIGLAPLLLNAEDRVALLGPNAQDFVVVAQPAGGVAPGGATVFEIALLTQSEGYKEAEVIIFNSDNQRNPYRFKIAGRVESLPLALPPGPFGQKSQVSPNPTTGRVLIEGSGLGGGQFKLLDSYGRLCMEGTLESTSWWLDLSAFPAGVYLFHWQSESQQGVERVVKY